ncbi:MAG: DUF2191 domain-containing protein [Vicinamibacteria bacterium]|jgi:hypothetical protein|nr:DUF2191 domain-containing protein [Vicinamibacteria bacterium]
MRTTLTIDDDLAGKLKAEVRRTGKSFKAVINDSLRTGLLLRRERKARTAFRVQARDLGALRPGLSLDNIGELLEMAEGSRRR